MPYLFVGGGAGFVPMRMTKSGNYTLTTTLTKVPAWSAAGTHPGTVIATDQLVASGGACAIRAQAQIAQLFSQTITLQVRVDGVAVGTASTTTANSGTLAVTAISATLAAGARVELVAWVGDTAGGPSLTAGVNTWVSIEAT